jgi:hypothetical protein
LLAEAAGFAFLAALSPTALAVMAVFMGSANPRQAVLAYVAGAVVMSAAMGIALLVAIRGAGLNLSRNHDPRFGLRLALGILALAAAIVIVRRGKRAAGTQTETDVSLGVVSRLVARPSPGSAFAAGVILFAPGATFIAAVQVIATASAGFPAIVLGLAIVVAVSVLIVWLPLLAFLLAPDATARRLGAVNGWLRVHGTAVAAGALTAGGVALVVNGALGLAGAA